MSSRQSGRCGRQGQLRAFLGTACRHRLFAFNRVAAYTGARRGELLNLRWRNIDLDLGEVRVTGSAAVIAEQRIEGTTKSSPSRTVSVDAEALQVLRDHRKRQTAERLRVGPDLTSAAADDERHHSRVASNTLSKSAAVRPGMSATVRDLHFAMKPVRAGRH